MKIKNFWWLISVIIIVFFSCTKQSEPNIGKDNYYISKKNPIKKENNRIVSVSPQITELLCDLGCKSRLVGRTDFCKYPLDIKSVPSIGGINNANLEKIISLKPDIVITSSIFTKKMFTTIEDAGIPIISFKESNKIEGMYNVITILGKITNKNNEAKALIANCKRQIQEIKTKRDSINSIRHITKKPKVYYVVGFGSSGDFSGGKDTYINEILTLSGGDNIAKESKMWSFSKEQLFKNQPDYIFVRQEDSALFVKTYPYKNLNAVKDHKVFGIESSLMDIQTPRSIKAIEFISHTISTK
jgi:iron complex transport system substrate-binding protein